MTKTSPQPQRRAWWTWASTLLLVLATAGSLWWAHQRQNSNGDSPTGQDGPLRPTEANLPGPPATDRTRAKNPAKVTHYGPTATPENMDPMPLVPPVVFEDENFIQGAALGLYLDLPELSYAQLFAEIKSLGATHVSLVVAWSMRDIRAVHIGPHDTETVSDARVRTYIQQARAAGLEVMLFPILHVDRRRPGEWRGKLAPRDLNRWWASYEHFILHYATLAEQEKVDIFSVGSELLSLEHEEVRWRNLIKKVRKIHPRRLTYSANWDHFDHVSFWSDLDIAGMTGYFELSDDLDPGLADLKQTWEGATDVISTYPERAGIPVMLTEVGYPSQVGSVSHPWDYTRRKAPDHHTQYLAFRAMYEAWAKRAQGVARGEHKTLGLAGFFVWNWYGYGGTGDISYTLRGKPAEAVIRHWFKGKKPNQDTTP